MFFSIPTNNRDWSEDQKILATSKFNESNVRVSNVRNFKYRSRFDYDQIYYDETYDLEKLDQVQLGHIPFSRFKPMAHILVVFKFSDAKEVVVSVEIRKPKGKQFSAWKSIFNAYELMYVIADPRDVIDLRNIHRKNEPVNLHLLNFTKEQRIKLFKNMLERANMLAEKPEFFNLFYNSCGSNVIDHLNEVLETKISWVYKYFSPGHLIQSKAIQKALKE